MISKAFLTNKTKIVSWKSNKIIINRSLVLKNKRLERTHLQSKKSSNWKATVLSEKFGPKTLMKNYVRWWKLYEKQNTLRWIPNSRVQFTSLTGYKSTISNNILWLERTVINLNWYKLVLLLLMKITTFSMKMLSGSLIYTLIYLKTSLTKTLSIFLRTQE